MAEPVRFVQRAFVDQLGERILGPFVREGGERRERFDVADRPQPPLDRRPACRVPAIDQIARVRMALEKRRAIASGAGARDRQTEVGDDEVDAIERGDPLAPRGETPIVFRAGIGHGAWGVTKLRLQPPSDDDRSVRESS